MREVASSGERRRPDRAPAAAVHRGAEDATAAAGQKGGEGEVQGRSFVAVDFPEA